MTIATVDDGDERGPLRNGGPMLVGDLDRGLLRIGHYENYGVRPAPRGPDDGTDPRAAEKAIKREAVPPKRQGRGGANHGSIVRATTEIGED